MLKLKVRIFKGYITFAEVTGEKLVSALFGSSTVIRVKRYGVLKLVNQFETK